MSAATAAEVVARRAWGEGSAPVLFLQAVMYGALKVCVCIILAVLVIVVLRLCVAYVIAAVSGSTSGFRKSTFGGIRPELTAHLFRLLRPVVLGFVVDMAFLLLIVIGLLLSFLVFGGSARRTGTHHRSSVEPLNSTKTVSVMKLRREGVRRFLQGATVPVQLMVVGYVCCHFEYPCGHLLPSWSLDSSQGYHALRVQHKGALDMEMEAKTPPSPRLGQAVGIVIFAYSQNDKPYNKKILICYIGQTN
uniref:Uncharacterized protein n=1 Tax=Aegilops tauschii TaxID=37682 RepID=M8C6Z4_AEGTA